MNIGIDVRKLRDFGIGTHIRNVVLPAARLSTQHSFSLYADPGDVQHDTDQIRWIPEQSGKYSLREQLALSSDARRDDLHLFHSPHYTLPLFLKCRSIVTIHDLIHVKFRELFPFWKVKAAEILLRKVIERADLILTVSETSRADIVEFSPHAARKIEVLYNRLSQEWLQPYEPINLSDLGIPSEYILYTGNFKKHKGIETLVDAYLLLPEKPALLLVGNRGGMEDSLRDKILSTPNVRLLGFADMRMLQNLYSRAMLFAFPSLYEGFGYPPLEAMCCGAPVLSSDTAALKEILQDAAAYFQAGNARDLADKLSHLLKDAGARRRLSGAGRNRVTMFLTDESPNRLSTIYNSFA